VDPRAARACRAEQALRHATVDAILCNARTPQGRQLRLLGLAYSSVRSRIARSNAARAATGPIEPARPRRRETREERSADLAALIVDVGRHRARATAMAGGAAERECRRRCTGTRARHTGLRQPLRPSSLLYRWPSTINCIDAGTPSRLGRAFIAPHRDQSI
jgi:hypothetical protein